MVIRRLGLKMTLLAFPCMCLAVVLMVMMVPKLHVSEDHEQNACRVCHGAIRFLIQPTAGPATCQHRRVGQQPYAGPEQLSALSPRACLTIFYPPPPEQKNAVIVGGVFGADPAQGLLVQPQQPVQGNPLPTHQFGSKIQEQGEAAGGEREMLMGCRAATSTAEEAK